MNRAVFREFYTERDVIKEERRRSYDSSSDGLLYETLLSAAYTLHPYRHPTIGWMTDIDHLTLDTVKSFHRKFYSPANTTIVLVGDISFETASTLVEKYFAKLPSEPKSVRLMVEEPMQTGERRAKVYFDSEPKLAIAYHKPTLPDRDDYVFDILEGILGEGRTSRLYSRLVIDRQIASDIDVFMAPGSRYPNLFIITATPRAPHTVSELETAISTELDTFLQTPPQVPELDRVRNRLKVDYLRQLRTNE